MSYAYAYAYDIGLSKKPVQTRLIKEPFTPIVNNTFNPPEKFTQFPDSGTSDPKIWGPPYWYSLHNSAAHYPINASPLVKERMKARILAIPYELPCQNCQLHASSYIEKFADKLDYIVSGRDNLVKFFVDFHNEVNKRYGKPTWSYEQAYKFYSNF
jgi:hypothetical protein